MSLHSNVVFLKGGVPNIENGKVIPPRRQPNATRRSREHLAPSEVEQLINPTSTVQRAISRNQEEWLDTWSCTHSHDDVEAFCLRVALMLRMTAPKKRFNKTLALQAFYLVLPLESALQAQLER
jgi:hypothetical protein